MKPRGSLDQALAEVRLRQQQLEQDLATLRRTLGGLCQRCPWGWAPFGGSCYLFAGGPRRWREAEGSCTAQGGHLLILDTPEEQEFVLRSAPQPRGYWLGLSDREQEGGVALAGRGPPGLQNCAALLPHGRWDDLACERALPWVCERPLPC
ncbi:C-type lectin domain family 17, member A-like [Pelecanus crispus]|uniref:C-type lectin domain family 17, member A-like n=1 Tax=Pelecanus crispus TaxID=36300 RepID=UPI003F5D176B